MYLRTFLAATLVGSLLAPLSHAGAPTGDPQTVVVHLSHFTGDLHRPFMAIKIATLMQKSGADVTLFLDLEGVRLADARQSLDLTWGPGSVPLSEHYSSFKKAGGKVVLCPHCAHAAALHTGDLREGATIATEEELGQMLLASNKILDY